MEHRFVINEETSIKVLAMVDKRVSLREIGQ